ncbi:MAG: hypothetical protein AB1758_16385 [Candidatus Eremiobacterota bacterium]
MPGKVMGSMRLGRAFLALLLLLAMGLPAFPQMPDDCCCADPCADCSLAPCPHPAANLERAPAPTAELLQIGCVPVCLVRLTPPVATTRPTWTQPRSRGPDGHDGLSPLTRDLPPPIA